MDYADLRSMNDPDIDGALVYRRDASFFRSPSTSAGPRSHFAHAYHWPRRDRSAGSACGIAMLYADTAEDPDEVSDLSRCQRPGCKQRWATA